MHDHFLVGMNSGLWWVGFSGSVIYIALVIWLGFFFRRSEREYSFRKGFAMLLLMRELFFYGYLWYNDAFHLADSLPLHLCGISYLCSIFALYTLNASVFEFLLLLGIGGAVQSIITPEMTHGYSPYLFLDYYIAHATIILTPIYLYYVVGLRLRHRAFFRIWIVAHVLLFSVGITNYFLHSNYIYLCEPPKVDNPLVTGGFPYHLIGFEIFGTIHILLFYFIFSRLTVKPAGNTTNLPEPPSINQ